MRSAVAPSSKDLILSTAFRVFGRSGIESTSLREVAREAEVSPALVVHHFGGKEGLIAALDEAVVREFAEAYAADAFEGDHDIVRRRGEQTVRVMGARPDVCAYVGRGMVEGTAGSLGLFRNMIRGGGAEIDSLAERGVLRPDVDRLWATLQHFFLIWAPLSFMPVLKEALGGDLLDQEQLDRWVDANVELLEEGLYA
ncbi:MAG TPA: helix-turn-helix domain-containing protein [Solirubrobacterales bacterium]|nr:helix-turn-helix domain-containing protein [Solirubrobacterales bacterium]